MFTFLFLRFSQSLDFKRVMRELNYAPRLVCAFLAGSNAIISNIVLSKCVANYPDFLKLSYYLMFIIVIVTGYIQLAYFLYGIVRVYLIGGFTEKRHHEM